MITRRENVELTPSALDLFTNEIIAFKRRELDSTQHKEVREYEQAQIIKVIDTEHSWCNSLDGCTVDIIPARNSVVIQLNPNKVQSKKPTELLTYQELQDTFGIIEARLHDQGIKTDINQAQIYSHDNSFDVPTYKPYEAYKPILAQTMSNKTIRNARARFQEATLYYGNKSNEITVYDKTAEYLFLEKFPLGFECTRFEYRHKKIKSLYRHSPKSLTADIYMKTRQADHEAITAHIFGGEAVTAVSSAIGLLNYLIYTDHKPLDCIKRLGGRYLKEDLDKHGLGLNEALTHYSPTDPRYKSKYRMVQMLTSLLSEYEDDEYLEAYYELKNKFKAVA